MYESFSQEVKNEISSGRFKNKCCRSSLLCGMIFGTCPSSEDLIELESENPSVVMLYAKLVKEFTGWKRDSDISLTSISSEARINTLKAGLGISSILSFDESLFKCEECRHSFLKGVFLTCGTVTYPENSYHMEFLISGDDRVDFLKEILSDLGQTPKITERKGGYLGLYYKDSESVVDLLGHLGANRATFKMLDIKIYKDLRNNANRRANCEMANIGKTVAASDAQIRAIEAIIDSGKSDELPEELKQTLDLRAAFPSATLNELAAMHTPPITKSGVNHRLKRLIAFSENIK